MLLSLLKAPLGRSIVARLPTHYAAKPTIMSKLAASRSFWSTPSLLEATTKKKTAPTTKKATTTKSVKKPAKKAVKKVTKKTAEKTVAKKKRVPPQQKILKKDIKPPFKAPPRSAWDAYVREYIDQHKNSQSIVDLFKGASLQWHNMGVAEQDRYAPSKEAREEFRKKLQDWLETLDPRVRRAYKVSKKRGSRAPSPYSMFVQANYTEAQGETFSERSRSLSEQWSNLTDAEKNVWVQRAQDAKEAFLKTQVDEKNAEARAE